MTYIPPAVIPIAVDEPLPIIVNEPLPITTDELPLPTGAATSVKQDTGNASLASIDTKLTEEATSAKQDTGNTSLASIDTKVATSAKQDTGNTSLASIDTKLTGTAISAKQPALGTAGTASSDVITVQGITNMTPLKVDGSAFTQPISGNLSASFDASNQSAFGTLESNELTPAIQGDFVYGLNTQIWNTGITSGTGATIDTTSGLLRIQSGTNSAGYAYITTRKIAKYRAGQGNVARFTPLFTTGVANNIQLWGVGTIASNAPYDGYFFGYNGTSFGIVHYARGTPTWTAQGSWNGDKCDGSGGTSFTYDPTKGTPAMIKYPYLGFGDILFFLQIPSSGKWTLVHTIRYANTVTTTQLSNPSMQYLGFTLNSGNTTNRTMYCGSFGVFLSGMRSFVGTPKWAADSTKSSISTETSLINLKNATTYNGITNRGLIRLNFLSCGTSSNSVATLMLKMGATIGGSPSYTAINGSTVDGGTTITNGNSIASYDTAGTTVSGGTYIFNTTIGDTGTSFVDLTPLDIFVAPGEILTASVKATANTQVGISLNWSEDI
jgi:hypothetical protein